MKKVLILLTSPKMGGAEKVMINIANKLDKRKFEVTFFLFFKRGVLYNKIDSSVNIDYAYDAEYKSMAIAIPHILKNLVLYRDYDVVVAGAEIWPTYIAMICHVLWGIKSVAWVHTNMKLIMTRYSFLKRWVFSWLNFISYKLINRIVVVSRACEMPWYIKINFKMKVIPNSYDREKIQELAKASVYDFDFSKLPVILSVSRMDRIKNLELLIKAHLLLCRKGVQQRLLLVGDGEDLGRLKVLAESLGVSKSVTFLGRKDNPYPYFVKSSIFVSASFVEGFSLVGMEAMFLGIPLVTTDYPNACAELVENNVSGIVVKNNSVDSLADGIKRILDDNNLREKLIQNGRGAVEKFDEKRIIREIEDYFCEFTKNDSERDF